MSTNKAYVLSKIPPGTGRALDLGGGKGELRGPLEGRGYTYFNLDLAPGAIGPSAAMLIDFRSAPGPSMSL